MWVLSSEERPRLGQRLGRHRYVVVGGRDGRGRRGSEDGRGEEQGLEQEIETGWAVRRVRTIAAKGKDCFHKPAMSRRNWLQSILC